MGHPRSEGAQTPLGRIKGAAFRQAVVYLVEHEAPQDVRAIFEPLAADHPRLFDLASPTMGVLASGWYPAQAVHTFVDALLEGRTLKERRALGEELAYATMSRLLRGPHRAILRILGTPDRHARFAQRLWDTHYDNGVLSVERTGEHESVVTRTSWRSHHPFLCEAGGAGTDKFLFPAMGLRGVTTGQARCISRGDADCAHWVRWQPV